MESDGDSPHLRQIRHKPNHKRCPDETNTDDNIHIDGTVKVGLIGDVDDDFDCDADDLFMYLALNTKISLDRQLQ